MAAQVAAESNAAANGPRDAGFLEFTGSQRGCGPGLSRSRLLSGSSAERSWVRFRRVATRSGVLRKLLVFVVAAPPVACLIAPLGGASAANSFTSLASSPLRTRTLADGAGRLCVSAPKNQ